LALRHSRLASDPLERRTWRRIASERASALTSWNNAYPHHTIAKAAVDDVRDMLHLAEVNQSEANVARLGEAIVHAEEALRRALEGFPNNPLLLSEQGELSTVLSEAQRAEAAFQKAFAANPRSTLLARRLSRIQRAKGAYVEALKTLRTSIEANPSSRELHYEIAMTLLDSAPDGDQKHSDDILYHLRRAFSPGDKSHHARFWYGRQLCLAGMYDDASVLFATLGEAKISNYEKTRVKGLVRENDGNPRKFIGTVVAVKPSYAFIQSDNPKMRVFVQIGENDGVGSKELAVGFPVTFELAFTMRGPTAQNVIFPETQK
jgi:tetratricopeptide (TPR) repeat protein